MSQEQPRRPQAEQVPIKYGDVFDVHGELASEPVAPEDAAMMQTAETRALGQTQKGRPAAVMQSAATRNERAGVVGHYDVSDVAREHGVSVVEADVPGSRIITETVAEQIVGQYVEPVPVAQTVTKALIQSLITIGEALEATARTCGNKPVDQSDAAAIQAAEIRATGTTMLIPGGLAASAQSAASANATIQSEAHKIKLGEILAGASTKLPADKAATRQDAEGVATAELRNNPNLTTHPGGVADSIAAAARLNENVNV